MQDPEGTEWMVKALIILKNRTDWEGICMSGLLDRRSPCMLGKIIKNVLNSRENKEM